LHEAVDRAKGGLSDAAVPAIARTAIFCEDLNLYLV